MAREWKIDDSKLRGESKVQLIEGSLREAFE